MDVLLGFPGGWQGGLRLIAGLTVAYLLILWLASILWVRRDIRSRTTDPTSHLVAVALAVMGVEAGFETPDAGRVLLEDRDIAADPAVRQRFETVGARILASTPEAVAARAKGDVIASRQGRLSATPAARRKCRRDSG